MIDREIKELINNQILQNALENCIDSVSCDLHIKYIIGEDGKELSVKELEPGETVMLAAEEMIELPEDIIGIVVHKNSRLRMGLSINAPVYRPGHKTRIFLSVSNLSGAKIELVAGEEIAAIMFDRLEKNRIRFTRAVSRMKTHIRAWQCIPVNGI
ncbi:MAG: hypothetical protein LIO53_02135 [Oscillospiraceae bacterium]|nr:hypothetical protein [Oscillospiraceae bacterium]